MKEIKPLTSLRAFAALLVFMYHYAWLFPPSARGVVGGDAWVPFMPVWRQGQVGVSIFFVLSGFLITRIYFDRMAVGAVPLRTFFVKRVARIWPLYLVFALVEHAVRVAAGTQPDRTALVTLSMTQGWFEGLRYAGLPTAWSLTIEETFYLLAPLLFVVLQRLTREGGRAGATLTPRRLLRIVAAVGLVVVALAGAGAAISRLVVALGWNWQGFMGSLDHVARGTIFGRFPEFAIGVVIAFVHRSGGFTRVLAGRRADVAVLGCVGLITASMVGKDALAGSAAASGRIATYALSYVLALGAGGLILALAVPDSIAERVLGHGLPVFLGRISYGFYLIQLTVIMTPLLALTDTTGAARLPLLLVLTNLVCAATYLLVEAPARRLIVARWGR